MAEIRKSHKTTKFYQKKFSKLGGWHNPLLKKNKELRHKHSPTAQSHHLFRSSLFF
jgi:hypothetical protein